MKRRHILGLVLAVVAGAWPVCAAEWRLVWSDEFDKPGLPDAAKWSYETGFIRNNELQFYTHDRRENARVENGMLIIEGRKERFANPDYKPDAASGRRRQVEFADYTAASLITEGKASFLYGRIEVRAKLPQGKGVWPAIWMLGVDRERVGWPRRGEIDIMEFVGFETNVIHANIHTGKYNHVRGTGKGGRLRVEAPFDDWHVYALEWHYDRLDFFVDDKKYFTYAKEKDAGTDVWPFDQPCYLILNLAIGGAWGGQRGIDDAIFPQRFEIDYVRVFEARKASSSK